MSKPITVAQVMGKMKGGGVESVVMNYYRNIDRDVVQFDFLVDADSTLVPLDEIAALGGRVIEVPPYQKLAEYSKFLEGLFRKEDWQIVHSHINALSVFPLRAAARANVPVRIAHSHSVSGKGEFKRNVLKAILKQFSNVYPTHRMACSNRTGEWLFGESAHFDVLHNAINLHQFAFDEEARQRFRRNYDISDSMLLLGTVGRLVTVKNQCFLIEVLRAVKDLRPDAKLMIVGDGSLKEAIQLKAKECGVEDDVVLTGNVSEVGPMYSAFDVFVLPSLYEGFPLTSVEAQFNGLKCAVSDRVPSEIDITGTTKFLSLDDDPRQWAHEIVGDEMVRLGQGGTEENHFDPYDIRREASRLTDYYLDLYEESGL